MELTRDQLLLQWQEAKTAADLAVAAERELRKAIFLMAFSNPKEGMNSLDLGQYGDEKWALKCELPYDYKLANKEGETGRALHAISELTAEGRFLAERLVRWQPELSVREYRALPPAPKSIIDRVLTIKPASLPQMKIEKVKR